MVALRCPSVGGEPCTHKSLCHSYADLWNSSLDLSDSHGLYHHKVSWPHLLPHNCKATNLHPMSQTLSLALYCSDAPLTSLSLVSLPQKNSHSLFGTMKFPLWNQNNQPSLCGTIVTIFMSCNCLLFCLPLFLSFWTTKEETILFSPSILNATVVPRIA